MSKIRFVNVIVKKANRKVEQRFVNGRNVLRTVDSRPLKHNEIDASIRKQLLAQGLIHGR